MTTTSSSTSTVKEYRQKATTVLTEFERSLARYYLAHSGREEELEAPTLALLRQSSKDESADLPVTSSARKFVENSYLFDLFEAILKLPADNTVSESVKALLAFCKSIQLGVIRNACAHPNRPFKEHYWRCIQALATHPVVMSLDMRDVVHQHVAARNGRYRVPPEVWMTTLAEAAIPNNLSLDVLRAHRAEHFIGRKKQLDELRKSLLNPRFPVIAATGPGGVGKTATVMEAVVGLVYDSKASVAFDKIVFVTAKQTQATYAGVEESAPDFAEADELISAIRYALHQSDMTEAQAVDMPENGESSPQELDDIFSSDERVLLCVDNLETLLVKNPRVFEDLNEQLPAPWRVVVTSRIPVAAASKNVALGAMSSADRNAFARSYLRRFNVPVNEQELAMVVEKCTTPLQLKLTLDGIRIGGRAARASLQESHEISAAFAYSNLLEHVAPDARRILDVLYAIPEPLTRLHVEVLLDLPSDRVVEQIQVLQQMGLVVPLSGGRVQLSDNLHDYLRDSGTEIPPGIVKKYNAHRLAARVASSGTNGCRLSVFEFHDVPEEMARSELAVTARKLKMGANYRRSSGYVRHAVRTLRTLQTQTDHPAPSRLLALCLSWIGDQSGAIRALEEILHRVPGDGPARLLLADHYKHNSRFDEALSLARALIDEGYFADSTCRPELRRMIAQIYVLSALWYAQEYRRQERAVEAERLALEAEDFCRTWRSTDSEIRAAMGVLFATCRRRNTESAQLQARLSALTEAVGVFREVFDDYGVQGWSLAEFFHLLEQFRYHSADPSAVAAVSAWDAIVGLIESHVGDIIAVDRRRGAEEYGAILAAMQAAAVHPQHPLQRLAGVSVSPTDSGAGRPDAAADELKAAGFVLVRVTNATTAAKGFIFAEDAEGRSYYCHRDAFVGEEFAAGVELGDVLWVNPGHPVTGKAVPATQVLRPSDR